MQMGTGHVIRCLTLAHALKNLHFKATFVCAALNGNMASYISQEGFECLTITPSHTSDLNTKDSSTRDFTISQEEDVQKTLEILNDKNVDYMFVDHYGINECWESRVKSKVNSVFVLDDLANRAHNCDIIIDQNLYLDFDQRYEKLVPENCKKLLGPKYALLRPEFRQFRELEKVENNDKVNFLVFFGGIDLCNETEKAIKGLLETKIPSLTATIVLGKNNPNISKIKTLLKNDPRFKIIVQAQNMAQLMSSADYAIGAGGSTHWERACLGLYSVICSIADNQYLLSSDLDQMKLIKFVGRREDTNSQAYSEAIKSIYKNPSSVKDTQNKLKKAVDGLGAERVAQFIKDYAT